LSLYIGDSTTACVLSCYLCLAAYTNLGATLMCAHTFLNALSPVLSSAISLRLHRTGRNGLESWAVCRRLHHVRRSCLSRSFSPHLTPSLAICVPLCLCAFVSLCVSVCGRVCGLGRSFSLPSPPLPCCLAVFMSSCLCPCACARMCACVSLCVCVCVRNAVVHSSRSDKQPFLLTDTGPVSYRGPGFDRLSP